MDDVHQQGLWHSSFACWLVSPQRQTLVLQLRGTKNRFDPGTFDASASGHLEAGEQPEDGFRELHEELGITVASDQRYYLGIYRNIGNRGDYRNREFCHVYMAICDLPLNRYTLEAGEVTGVYEIPVADGIDLFRYRADRIPAIGIQMTGTVLETASTDITRERMCNARDRIVLSNYYLKVLLAADTLVKYIPSTGAENPPILVI